MAEKKKPDLKEEHAELSSSFNVNLDLEDLNKMVSGTCAIAATIPTSGKMPVNVAVCKEGNTIKIFKIVKEKDK